MMDSVGFGTIVSVSSGVGGRREGRNGVVLKRGDRDDGLETGNPRDDETGMEDAPRGQRDSNRRDRVARCRIGYPAWIPEQSRAATNG